MGKFICTSDKYTMAELIALKFILLEYEDNMWTFLNDPNIKIPDNLKNNIVYTDKINLQEGAKDAKKVYDIRGSL